MAKSELMRPSWVCQKLCNSDTLSAAMLAEILFRSNVTKYKKSGNYQIVFSLQEWSDNTGLSIKQVRKALKRLTDLNIIKAYNAKHPHKNVLRALHVEVPHELRSLWFCLTSAGYKFDRDVLYSEQKHIEFRLSVAGCGHAEMPSVGYAIMPGGDMPVCPEGADLSICKKNNKEHLMAAAHKCATAEDNAQEEEKKKIEKKESNVENENINDENDIPDSLKKIKTLPNLLIALHDQHLRYFAELPDKDVHDRGFEAIFLWLKVYKEHHGEQIRVGDRDKVIAQFQMLVKELNEDATKLIEKVIPNWKKFIQHVQTENGVPTVPLKPDMDFFYYYRRYAMSLNLSTPDAVQSAAA